METLSYNEEKNKQNRLKHIFYPDKTAFLAEAVIGMTALLIFNATELSNRVFEVNSNTGNPLSYSFDLLIKMLDKFQRFYIVQQISLFLLWAVFGALVYILLFRLLQIIIGVSHSLNEGKNLYIQERNTGLIKWLGSMHDFFLKSLIIMSGVFVFIVGAFICFGAASQELRAALIYSFPSNVTAIVFSFITSIVSIRLVVLGMSLFSTRFRIWYNEA